MLLSSLGKIGKIQEERKQVNTGEIQWKYRGNTDEMIGK